MIGGFAVGTYGKTENIDVWVGRDPENARRVFNALRDFGMGPDEQTLENLRKEDQIVRMGRPPFRIEVLTTISGVRFPECYARKQVRDLDGVSVNLIRLEDLKVNKKASGRTKDLPIWKFFHDPRAGRLPPVIFTANNKPAKFCRAGESRCPPLKFTFTSNYFCALCPPFPPVALRRATEEIRTDLES